ncbi:hypothetical protein RCCRONUS_15 [Rhodobacter phage RcCronus]|uniref:Uncharacterized protein n=3 Tax=Cronusvirus cronus TaxID=2005060 RepID=A0A0K1LLC9_9CAUD|nr:hypothetical protein RCRHEA_15 [Rhodobacter phage RcRhea]YP_009616305.1 hypothetical protein FDI78_gp15 [Rhodobacter phage RcCronus]AKU43259.1 hypothetical protein RCRHEA_15 [Rhodobacter phage RcRhea]AKU43304.1 hypothetical protein RCCRONUS_15 [Rhodobacter phage RcCronus]AKY02682.1 hypothetical protein RCSAXON_15 [Rhodobacter phage RcSaxon]
MKTFVLALLADLAHPGTGWPVLFSLIVFQAWTGAL